MSDSDMVLPAVVLAAVYYLYKKGNDASDTIGTYSEYINTSVRDIFRGTSYSDTEKIFDARGIPVPSRAVYEDALKDMEYDPYKDAIRQTADNIDPLAAYQYKGGKMDLDIVPGTYPLPYAFSGVGTSPIIPDGNYASSAWGNMTKSDYVKVITPNAGGGVVRSAGGTVRPPDRYIWSTSGRYSNDSNSPTYLRTAAERGNYASQGGYDYSSGGVNSSMNDSITTRYS